MVDVFEYPHLPYWFTIKQAIGVVRKTLIKPEKCIDPRMVLVFDEKYNLIGILDFRMILQVLGPDTGPALDDGQKEIDGPMVSGYEAGMISGETRKRLEKPISDIMKPVKTFAAPDDPATKAALMMLRHDLAFLPVLENKQKLVGIIRLAEVFSEIFDRVLKSEPKNGI